MASTVNTPQAQALYHNHHSQFIEPSNSVGERDFAKEAHVPSQFLNTQSTYSIDGANKNNGVQDECHDDSGNGDVDMRKRQRVEYTAAEEDQHSEGINLSSIPAELIHLTLLNLLPAPSAHDTQTLSIDPRPNPTAAAELRRSLVNLSKVNKVFNEQVKPLLWKDVRVENGRGWMGVVEGLVPQSQYSEHHGHLHPHGHAQAPDPLSIENNHSSSPYLAASAHIQDAAHPHASPCIPAEPLPMLLPEEVSNNVPLRPNELTFSIAVAPVPEPVACGSCGIDMPQGPMALSIGNVSAVVEGSRSANALGLGLDTGMPSNGISAALLSPTSLGENSVAGSAAGPAATCDSCTASPPQQTRALLESPPLVVGQGSSSHRIASPRRPSFTAIRSFASSAHFHRHMPDTPHSTPLGFATPSVNAPANTDGPVAPPSTVSSRPIISIPQRMNPYLPSLLTPPSSRRSSPARWTRANSGSRSRSRSASQSQMRGRSPSPPPADNNAGRGGSRPGLTRAPSGLRRSLSPAGPLVGCGMMRRRMSGSRMRSTSPIDGVAVPLPSIDDDEFEGKGKGVAFGNKPSLGRRVSVRRGRGTDIGFAGYEHATFTAGIMQRLDALHPDDASKEEFAMAAPPRLELPEQDYFNYYDRDSDATLVDNTWQVEELDRALEVEAIHQHEEMDGVVPEVATLYDVEAKAKSVLQPDVAQEEVEGEWFDGFNAEQEAAPARPPIPQVRTLSFASFRTTGTYRTQEEAVRGKFVTPTRLLNVLRQVPRLKSLAMTEYVDSSLVKSVMEELFFRGYTKPAEAPRRLASMNENGDMLDEHFLFEQEEWNRRETFECVEAIDFTGCVSRVFSESLQAFVDDWLTAPTEAQTTEDQSGNDDRRGRSRDVRDITVAHELAHGELPAHPVDGATYAWKKPMFTGLKRLSLRGCVTLSSDTIARLILCCPNLTHLDLSFTRVAPSTLEALRSMPSVRLEALSLARSTRLSGESIREFLVEAPAAATIVDLNLFGDATYISPLSALDLESIITTAPCFRSKQLRYLDLSSAPLTSDMLDLVPAQPHLRSLGFSFIPFLELDAIAALLRDKAPNVEILTLTSSSTRVDLPPNLSALQTTMVLHQKLINPLTMAPFSIIPRPDAKIVSRLRILELSETVRKALGPTGGSRDWKVVKSKGGRGWYVDVSAGWLNKNDQEDTRTCRPLVGSREDDGSNPDDALVYTRGLSQDHPWRQYLSSLADAAGKVGSAVGWHSRKMEVVHGHGMLGREEGLYGAGAFAFEG
ncbi:hypothetical protein QFC21_003001 [Naganishia friedmannii]|uniref:Uncharacterized protein n=1 Tax=Naganishia friedmannii TaxID=89922 RepID=A0ACC2VUT6_9TREE|nr:hypothetical protein QFC21_003001 [Naganishia friedmannii]